MNNLHVAIIQQTCSDQYQENIEHSARLVRDAAEKGAELIVLQELHTGPYFCQIERTEFFELAETIPGPSTDYFGKLAAELGIVLVISLFEKRMTGLYHNTAVALEKDGSIAGIYRKMHIPDDPGFYEKFYFTPGDLGFSPIQTSVGKLGILVCWDQWFPEAARLMALAGADLLIYPTAIGWDPEDDFITHRRQQDAWQTVMRGHSVANHLPVLAPNRIGHEKDPSGQTKGIQFWGHSFITGPQGDIIEQADSESETILIASLDMARQRHSRQIWPFFRDRRIDHYGELDQLAISGETKRR